MTTEKLTAAEKRRQIHNCLLALWRWSEVDPETVNLTSWKCGTHACFGGHLTAWEEFMTQGCTVSTLGAPMFTSEGAAFPDYADCHLFGDDEMFNSRRMHREDRENPANTYDVSDYDLVVRRLERRLEELT